MASRDDPSVQLVNATQGLLIESRHRRALSMDRIAASLLRVTRRRRIAGSSEEDDDEVCALCARSVIADFSDWMKINDAVYHYRCWDRQARKADQAAQSKTTLRQ